MATTADILATAQQLRAGFADLGAAVVEADILQPAAILLDLYGEDIRSRAYVTNDPLQGEMMLRPDFTVPVVQMHMASHADPARYTYAGKVFRKQSFETARPSEYVQVGFEVFDGSNSAVADAEVFAAIATALGDAPVQAATGDIGLLIAAVTGLKTTDARKNALLRHLWRPNRFRALLDRFGGKVPPPATRTALLAADNPMQDAGVEIGLRSRADVQNRIEVLRADAAAAPISSEEIAIIDAILSLSDMAPVVLGTLRDIAVDLPAIQPALTQMDARLAALTARDINVDQLVFEGSYGRTSLEYYDGFVFGFSAVDRPDLPPVATGGRYDALTHKLGEGRAVPAVGGVIRPDRVVEVQSC